MPRLLKRFFIFGLFALLLLSGCKFLGGVQISDTALAYAVETVRAELTQTKAADPSTATATATPVPTETPIPTITLTPTLTPYLSPTATLDFYATPTINYPTGRVNVAQVNCRYGPGNAYLYEWGLYENERVTILGRNDLGTWVFVDPSSYFDRGAVFQLDPPVQALFFRDFGER